MKQISKSFRVNDEWFFGPVMALPTAMVMVVNRVRGRAVTAKTSTAFAAGIGLAVANPILGITLLSVYDDSAEIPQSLFSTTLGELPPSVMEDPAWPKGLARKLHRHAIFVLKPSVTDLTLSVVSGLKFRVGESRIHMEINPLGCRGVREFLQTNDWMPEIA